MALFQKSMQLRLKNHHFHFFCFKYVNVPMIILNEHVHLNMIDVYQEKQEWHSGNVPIIWTSSHQKENSQGKHIPQQIPQKDFLFKRSLIPQQGCSRITIFRRCDPRTRTWSDNASEDYASSLFPFERASELPVTFDSPSSSQRSFNRIPGFSKNFPSRGYSNKTKDHQRSQYIHDQLTSGNLFFQLEA